MTKMFVFQIEVGSIVVIFKMEVITYEVTVGLELDIKFVITI